MRIMTTYDSVQLKMNDMQGWLRPEQARRLWDLARGVPELGTIVEIGSFHGKSTVALASSVTDSASVYAIDPHAGNDREPGQWDGETAEGQADHDAFFENITANGVVDRVTYVREFSQDAHDLVPGDIDLLYVDGAHGYAPAMSDITRWGGRVTPGGAMAIHDVYTSLFVSLAVMRALWFSSTWQYAGRVRSLSVYRRVDVNGAARVRNVLAQLANVPWFVKNLVVRTLGAMGLHRLARLGHAPGGGVY
jgi:predicted O-methyltransferase YrrM